ncbi:7-cyano-7-deazaguanine synthase QueC [Zavarzinella formosa]|uniref:7-cyano-7-deazaguanine synthase QueC n=1 Tax=Zavarzinella formosa TaxID=360055 RepID=UPI0002D6295B|nr:7-cyano-7-deazaguanine synthase QueC [Zavarzinella formosa]
MSNAVVLLSGGLDSTTTLAFAKAKGHEVYALSVNYGQRHRVELDRAAIVAKQIGVRDHRFVRIDLLAIGGSALTDAIEVPKDRNEAEMAAGIPVTYVPARNTILLGIALGYAETVNAFDIFVGANSLDYAGYPDCRPEYLAAFGELANLATKAGVEKQGRYQIHAPLIHLSKGEIIREGIRLGVDYSQTVSCYDADENGHACGRCDSCHLRKKGFLEAGIPDPTIYRE